ncbi:MAG: sigma-70 family RNA polymerase sigma factor [Haliscomenobacter sp.]|nr:sigma-70 family RNA polymerase sigma factor [Haliscomenobacter sp.]
MAEPSSQPSIRNAIQRYGQRLSGFIRGRVRSRKMRKDILQEVWYQLSLLGDLNAIENLNAWLFRVARNRITDQYRQRAADSLDEAFYEGEDGAMELRNSSLPGRKTPTPGFSGRYFWEELMQALDELPPNQREVFVLNELEDKTLQEIADESGENLKTIISRKRYAVQHLRKRLQSLYDELNNLE